MASILITCYSRTGKTKLLAEAIGRGAAEIPGIKVDVLAFNRVTASDFVRYDGIILGSPVYFGGVASECKELIDDTTFVLGRPCGKVVQPSPPQATVPAAKKRQSSPSFRPCSFTA